MDRVVAAAELARLAEQAGRPELAKIALEFGMASTIQPTTNPTQGTWLDLSQFQPSSDSTDDSDVIDSARTWEHFEIEPNNNIIVQEAEDVDTVNLLPVTPGTCRTAKRRFRRQRVRQKLRLLEQFPQLTPNDLQCRQRLKLLEEW